MIHPANQTYLGIHGYVFAWFIVVTALGLFAYILYKRYLLIRSSQPDPRLTAIPRRFLDLILYGLVQLRQPRYYL